MPIRARTRRFALFLLVLFIGAAGASAAPLSTGRLGRAVACLGTILATDCSIGYIETNVPAGLAQINNASFSGAGDTLTVSASGNASFGVLSASASASYNITGPATNAWGLGNPSFEDIITIEFAPWDGQTGLLYAYYTLDGTISSTGTGAAIAGVEVAILPGTQFRGQSYNSSTAGRFSAGAPFEFVYGQPFEFLVSLATCAGVGVDFCGLPTSTGTGSGNADFSNTLVLSGLIPTDLNGNQAIGATFTSASGTQYTVNGVVPEPATLALFGLGLAGLAATGRRPWKQQVVHRSRPRTCTQH